MSKTNFEKTSRIRFEEALTKSITKKLNKSYIFENYKMALNTLDKKKTLLEDYKDQVLLPKAPSINGLEATLGWVRVSHIILITFSTSNTRLNYLDSSGRLLYTTSSGMAGLRGKHKTDRPVAVKRLLTLLNMYLYRLKLKRGGRSVINALHLRNVGSHRNSVIKIARQSFIISSIKTFNSVPYNGCRRKKIRRKKRTRSLFR